MSEELKATINRFIEGREKQLVEFEVVRLTQELKKSKTDVKEEQAKCDMAMSKLEQGKAEVVNEISLLKELLQ
jgi:hypothetical protein